MVCYSRAKIVPVDCDDSFLPTIKALENSYTNATNCKVLLLTNPGNPTGTVIPAPLLKEILAWANSKDLHVIVDEIYALSVFEESSSFKSVYSFDSLPNPQKTHIVWGVSKDLSMNGLRMGCAITLNEELIQTLHMFSLFTNMSQLTDAVVTNVLSDKKWVEEFFCQNIRAIQKQIGNFTNILDKHAIPYIKPTAAFFIWIDLRKWMPANASHADEMDLWRDFLEASLLISPGCAFHCKTPGWFRIVYSFDWESHFLLGIERLLGVLKNRRPFL